MPGMLEAGYTFLDSTNAFAHRARYPNTRFDYGVATREIEAYSKPDPNSVSSKVQKGAAIYLYRIYGVLREVATKYDTKDFPCEWGWIPEGSYIVKQLGKRD